VTRNPHGVHRLAYYLLLFARDDHGDRTTDGDREHVNQPAMCKAVKLTYSVTQVHPDEDGRVYISDTLGHYSDVPLLYEWVNGAPRKCQAAKHEATIQALTTLSAHDDVDGNEETTMNQPCGGVTVHFKPIDPDSETLWDPDAGGDDNQGGNGSVAPASKVAERKQVEVNGNPQTIAVAETTLTFTDQYSGDNYTVEASPYDQPLPEGEPDPKKSGTLTAWKLIYYERDRMPQPDVHVHSWLLHDAPEGQDYVVPEFLVTPDWVGEPVIVFDGEHHDMDDPKVNYTVDRLETGRIYLDRPLQYPFKNYAHSAGGIVCHPRAEASWCNSFDPALLAAALGDQRGFVAFKAYPKQGLILTIVRKSL